MSAQLNEIKLLLISGATLKNNEEYYKKMVPGKQKVYGIKTPVLNEIARKYKTGSFALASELWKAGSLEERVIAIKIIEKKGKENPDLVLKLFCEFSAGVDNWAVCDGLGMQFLSGIRKTHHKEIFSLAKIYSVSANSWQRRLSLVMVEWYTRASEFHPAIHKLVKTLEEDDEYYVRKAVAWIRKNFSKGK